MAGLRYGLAALADQFGPFGRNVEPATRIRAALPYVDPDRLIIAPDCGMKYHSRQVAFGKLKAMVDGAAIVRRELAG